MGEKEEKKVSPVTHIIVKNAHEHNLKNVDLILPKRKLIVFSGLSGSGKSTMAMDTIYAEGQRRYVESLSTYARQFLGEIKRPKVDKIEGLSPSIAIDQKTSSHNPRSTVGTVTEIYDYLRLLFARIGIPYCIYCGRQLVALSKDEVVERILGLIERELQDSSGKKYGFRAILVAPIVEEKKGSFEQTFINLRKEGWNEVYIDNKLFDLDVGFPSLDKNKKHSIWVVIDRLYVTADELKEIATSYDFSAQLSSDLDQAYKLEPSRVFLLIVRDKVEGFPKNPTHLEKVEFNTASFCPEHDFSVPQLEPRHFSFNSPISACERCEGLGYLKQVSPELIVDKEKTLDEGGVFPFNRYSTLIPDPFDKMRRLFFEVAYQNDIPRGVPIKNIPSYKLDILLYGDNKEYTVSTSFVGGSRTYRLIWNGVINWLTERYYATKSESVRSLIEKYMVELPCPVCKGQRLKKQFLSVKVDGLNIYEVGELSTKDLAEWIKKLPSKLSPQKQTIAKPILKEILTRLDFLNDVGLSYLTINRRSNTLSGGEAQRIRLASQIGTGLTDVIYVLDEPSIGLHARDQSRLIKTLKKLRDLGNTIIVVEHDRETIESADVVVEFGPKAGSEGGKITFVGTVEELKKSDTLTGKYLSGRRSVSSVVKKILKKEKVLTEPNYDIKYKHYVRIEGVKTHNLKNITVDFPLGRFIVVTGVSGSGKSSLVVDTLYPALRNLLGYKEVASYASYKKISLNGPLHRVVLVDQSPIGRTPRSNPATYTGVFDDIRRLFANTKEAKIKGYPPGYFSFNVRGGRCEACKGEGQIRIEMMFLPDVYVTCEVCGGKRYTKEVLSVYYKGKNIADVLNMTIDEAYGFFAHIPSIRTKLKLLVDVGLGYMKLGQPAPTLSGGEAQRVKLAAELYRSSARKTFYILDEPTTGLHFEDVARLIAVIRRLVSKGHTVVVIEHNLDLIRAADWIIDLGPEGGEGGGEVLYAGPLPHIKDVKESVTAKWLFK